MGKKETPRQQGECLNKEGRLSPLDVIQRRMEHFDKLAVEEIAKGAEGSEETIAEYLSQAQDAAVQLAPYRHPRLQATSNEVVVRHAVIRSPELCDTNEDWIQKYVPKDLRDKPKTEIDGEVVASTTAASPPPTPQPSSTAVGLYDPNSFQLEVIQNRSTTRGHEAGRL